MVPAPAGWYIVELVDPEDPEGPYSGDDVIKSPICAFRITHTTWTDNDEKGRPHSHQGCWAAPITLDLNDPEGEHWVMSPGGEITQSENMTLGGLHEFLEYHNKEREKLRAAKA